ncbi:hypothetical protein BJ166DRAFT_521596 [Pestalotiopsis sp. NC0098]|nr:hypothetical protein BJ166DRAFT_521596 [Pestalotiopsis sp. NC0098]
MERHDGLSIHQLLFAILGSTYFHSLVLRSFDFCHLRIVEYRVWSSLLCFVCVSIQFILILAILETWML